LQIGALQIGALQIGALQIAAFHGGHCVAPITTWQRPPPPDGADQTVIVCHCAAECVLNGPLFFGHKRAQTRAVVTAV